MEEAFVPLQTPTVENFEPSTYIFPNPLPAAHAVRLFLAGSGTCPPLRRFKRKRFSQKSQNIFTYLKRFSLWCMGLFRQQNPQCADVAHFDDIFQPISEVTANAVAVVGFRCIREAVPSDYETRDNVVISTAYRSMLSATKALASSMPATAAATRHSATSSGSASCGSASSGSASSVPATATATSVRVVAVTTETAIQIRQPPQQSTPLQKRKRVHHNNLFLQSAAVLESRQAESAAS